MELPINYEKSHWSARKQAREEYMKLQDGKCIHCGNDLAGPASKEMLKKKCLKSA